VIDRVRKIGEISTEGIVVATGGEERRNREVSQGAIRAERTKKQSGF
jgi:hypothetical protein